MNYILAFVMFFLVVFFKGLPEASPDPVLGDLAPDYPAITAGLQKDDRILKAGEVEIATWADLARFIHKHPKMPVEIQYARDGKVATLTLTPRLDSASGRGLIGIVPKIDYTKVGFFSAVKHSIGQCWYWTAFTVEQLASKMIKREKPDLAGPVGIVQMVSKAAHSGLEDFVFLIGLISVAIGFFNILPIPLLDGGHGIMYLWEGLSGRKLTTQIMGAVNSVGLVFLLSLLVFATFNDVMRIRDSRAAKREAIAAAAADKPIPLKK
ncbi:MAG: RIP metalloprotease RseP [Elusimicrobia bacterium]|nr:MAG: RIP metalloprotease RseP [Elusimicrobiota bacterium]